LTSMLRRAGPLYFHHRCYLSEERLRCLFPDLDKNSEMQNQLGRYAALNSAALFGRAESGTSLAVSCSRVRIQTSRRIASAQLKQRNEGALDQSPLCSQIPHWVFINYLLRAMPLSLASADVMEYSNPGAKSKDLHFHPHLCPKSLWKKKLPATSRGGGDQGIDQQSALSI
jgi:hypothetical protein